MPKELYIAAHEELIEEYLEEHPDADEAEAYDVTADAAHGRMVDKIADMMDHGRDLAKDAPRPRRAKAPEGECLTCAKERKKGNSFHPPHDASASCESGKHNHCSCDTCF